MIQKIFWFFLVLFLSINIFVFVGNIYLGEEIKVYDKKISVIRQENLDLETKIFKLSSYETIASLAAQLNFVKDEMPIFIENLKYAYKK